MARSKPFTKEFVEQIAGEYADGATSTALAARYGISKSSVTNAVRRMGGSMHPASTHKFDDETQRQIAAEYATGVSGDVLAKKWGVSRRTIIGYVRRQGVEVRTPGGKLTPSQGKQIAEAYAAGASSTEVSRQFNVAVETVLRCARRYGVPVRTRGDYPSTRKYFFNEHFFSEWSPDMAYVLGFLFADGSLEKSGGRIYFYQKAPAILYDIARVIGYDGPLHKVGTNREIHALVLSSKVMVNSLAQYGLYPGPISFIIRVPDHVPYPADFVRGYFDGDGYSRYYRDEKLLIGFTSAAKQFLLDLANRLSPVPMNGPYVSRQTHFEIRCLSHRALTFRDWMYCTESTLWIEKKRLKMYRP
jgi:transposase